MVRKEGNVNFRNFRKYADEIHSELIRKLDIYEEVVEIKESEVHQ